MLEQDVVNFEIANGIDGVNEYFNSDCNFRHIKNVIKSADFKTKTPAEKEKLLAMFDYSQKVSCDVLKKQLSLFVELLNDGVNLENVFPEFFQYVKNIFDKDVCLLSNDELKVILMAISKLKSKQKIAEIENFKSEVATLYLQDIDKMDNQHLSVLIGHIKGLHYYDLEPEMQSFVKELFKRCSVKAETSKNNKNYFSTKEWFKDNASNFYGQFNKAFFGQPLQEPPILDAPTKKITFDRLVDYANLQYAFIDEVQNHVLPSKTAPSQFFSRRPATCVYQIASDCCLYLGLAKFPKEDDPKKSNFYLKGAREYKQSVAPKMANLFVEMVQDSLLQIKYGGKPQAQILGEFANTIKQKNELKTIVSRYEKSGVINAFYSNAGSWLVNMINLDKLSGLDKSEIVLLENEDGKDEDFKEEFLEREDFLRGGEFDDEAYEAIALKSPYMTAQIKNRAQAQALNTRQQTIKTQMQKPTRVLKTGGEEKYKVVENGGLEQYSFELGEE